MIKIVTDSTCDLPDEIIKKLDITVVPGYINLDGISYLDGVDLTREEFYRRLPDSNPFPTTSAPGTGAFIKVYQQILAAGVDGILSIHISPRLSNIANIASLAAAEVDTARVHTIDSGNLTMSTGLLVEKAALLANNGRSLLEIETEILATSKRTYSFARLETLEYLRRSGRVSDLKTGLASMLEIKPIMKMHRGVPEMEMVRTLKRADQRLSELVCEMKHIERIGVVHANAREKAEKIISQLRPDLPAGIEILMNDVTPVIGAHVGPGAICFCIIAGEENPEERSIVGHLIKKLQGSSHEGGNA